MIGGPKVKKAEAKKKRVKEFQDPYTVTGALVKGNIITKLSLLIMGLGNIAHKQVIKGLIYLAVEISWLVYMIQYGFYSMSMLPSLGWREQQKVWNDAKSIFEYTAGDQSSLILLYGVATIFVTFLFIIVWRDSVKSGYKVELLAKEGKHINTFKEDFKSLFDKNLHKLLLAGPIMGVLVFTVLPLLYNITMAFTNYSKIGDKLVLFDWVGLANFKKILNIKDGIGGQFYSVLGWTLIWAVFATVLNYIFGMILAIVINRKDTKAKGFWRFCFVISIAVPQFVSLLIMRTMLQPTGIVNTLLLKYGLIDKALPFFTSATWARVTVIVINLWVGIPYTLLQVTGILQNIPAELYEAAKIDGANAVQTFFKITLPYMLFVMTPYLITQFTGNINNFNVIFLLSGGNPTGVGDTAGKTDLLVTWLYKLTVDKSYYNLGAVIGIMTFIVLAIVALVTYRNTTSYKDEEGFM
ncbi:MAG: sugar ABC transporter permease [Clostridiales bacterium]|uniref:carbohydrate ABC transporter permease n=1 Tax=Roseburia sp. MSJ-14 TaxID=2841514 RepID=UPI00095FAABC|nr:sugar ABC transporter permease [Roseburia sp. MSJ-14]MBU5473643.1 sugar ABC transporter permease [Roseburia sp. MSJ-14]NLK76392.1 sugar ABC transporter permease [Clostridiales bacterium]OLA85941.1 MAG: sugar ABC transporter permease [Roseburia sp. 40_7]